ncbi:hypothetical protein MTR_8g032430 [Medicago truncatula]|uniref:Uncharacterized protein n=1 Tax=Medicago truncatula TaxID=3880 RepID=G7LCP8_MEDTR|nr:hypothetical protein MTR_8g032430 [Medicago truncatula]
MGFVNWEEVEANASLGKSGRNLTVIALEFKLKKTGNLVYLTNEGREIRDPALLLIISP